MVDNKGVLLQACTALRSPRTPFAATRVTGFIFFGQKSSSRLHTEVTLQAPYQSHANGLILPGIEQYIHRKTAADFTVNKFFFIGGSLRANLANGIAK